MDEMRYAEVLKLEIQRQCEVIGANQHRDVPGFATPGDQAGDMRAKA